MITCGNCKTRNPDGEKFCFVCGQDFPTAGERSLAEMTRLMTVGGQAIGPDISTWQDSPQIPGTVDFARMAQISDFVIFKKSQGGYQDPDFAIYERNSRPFFTVRGAYHFLTWDTPTAVQVSAFTQGGQGDFQFAVVDYEYRTNIPSPGTCRTMLRDMLTGVMSATGLDANHVLIYTSPYFWREYGSPDAYWRQFPLWIANYGVSHPMIPAPWLSYQFWQFTDSGNGAEYGVESREIDLNLFRGSRTALDLWAGTRPPEPPPPETTMRFITLGVMNVRAEHTTASPIVRQLPAGAVVTATRIWAPTTSGAAWAYDATAGGWIAITIGVSQYMRSEDQT